MPGHPGPSTTSISPAGAGTAPSCRMAPRAASCARVSGLLSPRELVEPRSAAAARRTLGGGRAFLGDDEDVEPAKGLGVAGEGAVGGGDQDAAQLFGVACPHLDDARVVGAGGAVGAQNQLQPRGQVQIEAAQRNRIEIGG